MCGRYTSRLTWSEIKALYDLTTPWIESNLQPRYNVAPTQSMAVVVLDTERRRVARMMRWGLIPSWAKDAKIGMSTINARAESVREKPAFRAAFKQRRALIPAQGFFEWRPEGRAKQAYLLQPRDHGAISFAGLWESWRDGDTAVETFSIITTEANQTCAPIHHRMPVILDAADFPLWLGEQAAGDDELHALLRPAPEALLEILPVSARVGKVTNDDPDLLKPAEPAKPEPPAQAQLL